MQENGVTGIYTLDPNSQDLNKTASRYYNNLGFNKIQIDQGRVVNYNFYAINTIQSGSSLNYGRNFYLDEFDTSLYIDPFSQTSYTDNRATINFTQPTSAVPFNFSPEQGLVLGIPLFISLRILKKRMVLKRSKAKQEETGLFHSRR